MIDYSYVFLRMLCIEERHAMVEQGRVGRKIVLHFRVKGERMAVR
jgi:hypothetical protein